MQTLTSEPQANLMLARYYSPAGTFRFGSVDPGDDTYLDEPQSWNKYAYVRNNPVNSHDPDGELGIVGALVGGAVGGIAGGLLEAATQLATTGELDGQKIKAAVAGGAVTGALAGATGGASLLVQASVGLGASVAGGMVERGLDGDASTEVLSGSEVASDVVLGGVGGGVGAKVGELAEGAYKTSKGFGKQLKQAQKEVKRVDQRSASRQAPAREAQKRVEQKPQVVRQAADTATGAAAESTGNATRPHTEKEREH